MYSYTFDLTIPAGVSSSGGNNYVPHNITHDCEIQVEMLNSHPDGMRPDLDIDIVRQSVMVNPNAHPSLKYNAVPYERKLRITISQDYPLNTNPMGVLPYSANRSYDIGHSCIYKGKIVHWLKYVSPNEVIDGSMWVSYTHPAQKIEMFHLNGDQSVPEGYWPCDGSIINAPWSSLHNTRAPDYRARSPRGIYYSAGNNSGYTTGSDFVKISEWNLPTTSYPLSIQNKEAAVLNTPSLMRPIDTAGDPDGATDTNGSYPRAYWRGISYSSVSVTVPAHNHEGSVRINRNATQTDLTITPPVTYTMFAISL